MGWLSSATGPAPENPPPMTPHSGIECWPLLEQPPPKGLSHWDGPTVASTLGASVHAIWRVLRKEGIYLQRLRTWCVSTDPEFAPKAADVIGLYLNPPRNALVLSVDDSFANKDQLRLAIEAFVARTNEHLKPFHWRKREVKGSQLRNTIVNLRN
jgi:hypothetical protein